MESGHVLAESGRQQSSPARNGVGYFQEKNQDCGTNKVYLNRKEKEIWKESDLYCESSAIGSSAVVTHGLKMEVAFIALRFQ